jgi:hypothetical protein
MKVGILFICIGKYRIFFDDFYSSCEKYFLPEHKKHYYVFTDNVMDDAENITKIYQADLGWPHNTLNRFDMFSSISDLLSKEDFLFFFNANMKFIDYVKEEALPKPENEGLMGVQHPGYYNKDKEHFTYERRKESVFYIPYDDGKHYYQGCFNGGKSEEFLKMSKTLNDLIKYDLLKGIMPIWHDESALNWYYLDKNPLILNPGYSYPEGWDLPFTKKIIQLDKNNFGGYTFLRNIK